MLRRSYRGRKFFFFIRTATTEIYTLSLHDALPIYTWPCAKRSTSPATPRCASRLPRAKKKRSEEHTSELQSHHDLVCRLLLEKKNKNYGIDRLHHVENPPPYLVRLELVLRLLVRTS